MYFISLLLTYRNMIKLCMLTLYLERLINLLFLRIHPDTLLNFPCRHGISEWWKFCFFSNLYHSFHFLPAARASASGMILSRDGESENPSPSLLLANERKINVYKWKHFILKYAANKDKISQKKKWSKKAVQFKFLNIHNRCFSLLTHLLKTIMYAYKNNYSW